MDTYPSLVANLHRFLFATILLLVAMAGSDLSAATRADGAAPSSVVVKLRTHAVPAQFLASVHTAGVARAHSLLAPRAKSVQPQVLSAPSYKVLERYVIVTPDSGVSASRLAELLRERGDVEVAELNTLRHIETSNHTLLSTTNDRSAEQWALSAIQAEKAWKKATGKGVVVAIVDTGLDFNHPEFAGQLYINAAEDGNGNGTFEPWPSDQIINGQNGDLDGIDNDNNGYIDDVSGYDFVDNTLPNFGDARTRDPIALDEHGHGTSVAGIIAARNDGNGITGVAYNAKLLTLRAFDARGTGEDDDFAAAIVYAALNGARVINMSFGDVYIATILQDAIAFANDLGCVLVSSAGNSNSTQPHFPSDFSEVIAVGSSTQTDARFQSSNYGSLVDMVAPGASVLTTALNGVYAQENGTSFSSPHVAAVSALLVEQRPALTPVEIRGILTSTADDLGDRGWDMNFGAGRLNAAAALDMSADAAVLISFPPLDYLVNTAETSVLEVQGSVFAPFFRSYSVGITTERNASVDTLWRTITTSTYQISHATLASLPLIGMDNGVYMLRIRIEQSDGTALERRQRFALSNEKVAFTVFSQYPAWSNDDRTVVVSARTNHRTRMAVRFRPKGSSAPYRELTETDRFTHTHTVVFGSDVEAGVTYEAEAIATTTGGDSAQVAFEFQRETAALPRSSMRQLDYTLPAGFLLNQTADFYDDGSASVVVASSEDNTAMTRVFSFRANSNAFVQRDSVAFLWIPRDIGDSDGDGRPELFSQYGPRSSLFEKQGSSLFGNRVFSDDTPQSDFWASTMADLDGDGREELIGRSSTSYIVYKYNNGVYTVNATTSENLPQPDPAGQIAVGDFDGDGKQELCYGSAQGGVIILEYRNGVFATEYNSDNDGFDGNYFISTADVDGDGTKEILICTYKGTSFNADREYDTPLWSFRLLHATAANTYAVLWQDYRYGVRPPNPYRSGVAADNIDGRPGDELIILAFPGTHVFTWDAVLRRVVPFWYFPVSLSNTAIVHDFNGNGIQELGFVTSGRTEFFEYTGTTSQPLAPAGLDGYATSSTGVRLQWNAVPQAQYYIVYGGKITGNQPVQVQAMGTTATASIELSALSPDTEYLFVVTAFSEEFPEQESDFSGDITVFTHTPAAPLSVQVIDRFALRVRFSGNIPEAALEPSVFTAAGTGFPSTVISSGDQFAVLRFAFPLPVGSQRLLVASFRDRYNSPTATGDLAFDIAPPNDQPELYLTAVRVVNATTLHLSFSEPVTSTATETSHYTLAPVGAIATATLLDTDKQTVQLALNPDVPLRAIGKNYILTASNITAQSGHALTTGPGKSIGFTVETPGIAEAYTYPNPVRLSEEASVFFGNIEFGAEITIRTMEGAVITTLRETDGNGGVEWDCRDNTGALIGTGVYLYSVRVADSTGTVVESGIKKFAVLR